MLFYGQTFQDWPNQQEINSTPNIHQFIGGTGIILGADTAFEEEIKSSSGCRPMSKYRQMSRSDISCPPAFNGQSPIDRSTSALQMVMVLRNRIRTLPRGGMYQKMHPRDPRDFLRAVILHPEAREIVRGRSPRGNLEGRGTINYLRWI